MRGLLEADAAGGGEARGSAARLHPGGVGDDDLGTVVHAGFGRFSEGQFVVLNHYIPASRDVGGIVQGADLGLGLIFKVQLHILNPHLSSPWSVVDIGHGATFGGHVTQVYLLGLDLNLSPSCLVMHFIQGATLGLNVAEVQFHARDHDLSPFRLVFEVGSGVDLRLDVLDIGQRLVDDLQLPLHRGRRLGRGPDYRHFLLLQDAEGLRRVAARGARPRGAARVAGGRARCDS